MIKYARLFIEIPLDSNFPDHIEFFNEEEVLIRQQVHYEWKPIKCNHCKMFGLEVTTCRKKGGARTEWRPVQKDTSERTSQEQPM